MGVRETAVIYLLIGVAVGVAVALRESAARPARRAFSGAAAALFWPLFAPVVLAGKTAHPAAPGAEGASLDVRIRFAEERLVSALSRIQGVAEEVVAPEVARVRGLAGSMTAMAERMRQMTALLGASEFDADAARAALETLTTRGVRDDDPRAQSVRARLKNIERLEAMRNRTGDDLERILLKLEEMSSQIQLLAFAGRSDADVVAMIKEIAETVAHATEGLLDGT